MGGFVQGLREGQGTYTYCKGRRVYEGSWRQSQKSGFGKEVWTHRDHPDRMVGFYEGQYERDVFHGEGLLCRGNSKYKGHFHGGLKHGWGRMEFTNGDVYEGLWENDQMHDDTKEAKYVKVDSSALKKNQPPAKWKRNIIYKGQFVHGQRSGVGKEVRPKVEAYEGGWLGKLAHIRKIRNDMEDLII